VPYALLEILDLVQPLDEIMADRGFNIEEDLKKKCAKSDHS